MALIGIPSTLFFFFLSGFVYEHKTRFFSTCQEKEQQNHFLSSANRSCRLFLKVTAILIFLFFSKYWLNSLFFFKNKISFLTLHFTREIFSSPIWKSGKSKRLLIKVRNNSIDYPFRIWHAYRIKLITKLLSCH